MNKRELDVLVERYRKGLRAVCRARSWTRLRVLGEVWGKVSHALLLEVGYESLAKIRADALRRLWK